MVRAIMFDPRLLILLLVVLSLQHGGAALKFLVYNPKFLGSHALFMGKLADQLAVAGHDVVVLQSVMNPGVHFPGHTHPNVRLFERPATTLFNPPDDYYNAMWDPEESMPGLSIMGRSFYTNCVEELKDTELMERLRAEKFDLAIGEWFDICGLGIFEHIGVKRWITAYSGCILPNHLAKLGVPPMAGHLPDYNNIEAERTFRNRVSDFFGYLIGEYIHFPSLIHKTASAFKDVLGRPVDPDELVARSSFLWENAEELLDISRPISYKVVGIAGLGMRAMLNKTKPLEPQYVDVFSKAKRGVIYMSFGSVAQSWRMPTTLKKTFLDAFAEFPEIEFIWKYERPEDNITDGYPNVHADKWLPQRDILLHPRTLAFITHGGMNGITEAIWSGMPMISIPLFAEQPRNAAVLKWKGVGVVLQKKQLFDKKNIVNAIREIVENPRYRENAKEIAEIVRNKPQSPEERLVKSAEFAARFNVEPHLNIDSRHMSTIAFYSYDIIALTAITSIAIVSLLSLLSIRLTRYLYSLCNKQKVE